MLTEYTPDVVALSAREASDLLEKSGKKVQYKIIGTQDYSVEQLRVIRQKDIGEDFTECVVSQRTDYMERGWK